MIISHKHRYIFIAIPKTGTHAIRRALRKTMGDEDEEQVGLFEKSQLGHPALAALGHGHITAVQASTHLEEAVWKNYFKFAFVRNPFDRLVSYAYFFYGKEPLMKSHPTLHMKRMLLFPEKERTLWFRPQVDFVLDSYGALAIDFVGKTEKIQTDFDRVCDRIGLPYQKLERVNASAHDPYLRYYDEQLELLARKYYAKDFEQFDY